MSMLRNALALAGLVGGLCSGSASATVCNYETDFSDNLVPQVGNGPANAWFYFYAAPDDHDGIYTLFTQTGGANGLTGYVHQNNGFHLALPGLVHPGNSPSDAEPDVIVGFRVPSATPLDAVTRLPGGLRLRIG